MSRRKRHGEHANHERWLVSYADFITLLFAFFVVMYSSSQVDKRKVGKIALAIQVAFQQMGLFPSSNSRAGLSMSEPMPFSEVQMAENAIRTETLGRVTPRPTGTMDAASGVASPKGVREALEKALAPEIRRRTLSVNTGREGVVVSLREVGFFDSGSATLKPGAEEAVRKVAEILAPRPDSVRIEGHTDNVPIHTTKFASNWELSTARATELVRLLAERYGLSADRLSVAGYAEFHPLASNTTAEGRALNRRVDIVVIAPHPIQNPSDASGGKGTDTAPSSANNVRGTSDNTLKRTTSCFSQSYGFSPGAQSFHVPEPPAA